MFIEDHRAKRAPQRGAMYRHGFNSTCGATNIAPRWGAAAQSLIPINIAPRWGAVILCDRGLA